jgi:hypothetical protein
MTTQVMAPGGGMETRKRRGAHAAEKLTTALGIGAILLLMILSALVPEPAQFQLQVFRVVLALGAGAVVAALPGMLSFEGAIRENWKIRGSGAVGIFVLLYFFNPAERVIPSSDPVVVKLVEQGPKENTRVTCTVSNRDDHSPIVDARIGFQTKNGRNHFISSHESDGSYSMDFSQVDQERLPVFVVVEFPSFNGKIVVTNYRLRREEIPLKLDLLASRKEILKLVDSPEEARR